MFTDLDNDGFKDLFITNGYRKDYTNMDFMNYVVQEKINERKTKEKIKLTELIEKMPSTVRKTIHTKIMEFDLFQDEQRLGSRSKNSFNGAAYADFTR